MQYSGSIRTLANTKKILEWMNQHALSEKDLAEKLGYDLVYFKKVLYQKEEISLEFMKKLCNLTKLDLKEIAVTERKHFFLGDQIKKFRLEKHVSQERLGKAIGMSKQAISSYETGVRDVDSDVRMKIADFFSITLAELHGASSFPPEAMPSKNIINVPVLGNAPAGPKSFVQDEVQEWVSLPKELAKGKRLYLLRVTGDSMNQGGIKKGSMVIVDADVQPENGDIVVIRIDGETTIKRFKKYDNIIVLTPESSNPVHKEQSYTNKNDIQLRGVVKGVWWS